jgi:pyruvate/2-oxoglutarate dehydrogenase complex dihydrolipoamide acyltransferase (E2) component
MQFGISINGDSPKSHNKLEAAVEAFLAELEGVEGITVNVTGYAHDRTQTRTMGRLPREGTAEKVAEQAAEAKPSRAKGGKPAAADKLGPGESWDATDAATKEAKKRHVDMAEVEGTGAGGTVTKTDVEEHAKTE